MTYLDNASTSFPKPPEVARAVSDYLTQYGVSPGRGTYGLSERCEEMVNETRVRLARLIGAKKASHVVWTLNATHGLNIAIKGVLKAGDHALACDRNHNSVVRPLEMLRRTLNVDYDLFTNAADLALAIRSNTRLVVCNHASNVTGHISDLESIAKVCQERGVLLLVDCTQSIVHVGIDVESTPIDILVGTGHKTLLGPSGVGFMWVRDPRTVDPLYEGGTGGGLSISRLHPKTMPHRYEAGTPNTASIAGLRASLDWLEGRNHDSTVELAMWLERELLSFDGISVIEPGNWNHRVPIISFQCDRHLPAEMAHLYDQQGICVRAGVQCAPLVHEKLGTLPSGTVRVSLGRFNTESDVLWFVECTKKIMKESSYVQACAG